ncbi:MAG TPA: FtsX-like permease family protein [Bacteroidales bacterium]|nr:FtsX-like permease family protein [Bacteroidales bacterium]
MFRNYLKTTLTYIRQRKSYSIINIACLSFGLACAIFAILYIFDMLSYDRFNKNYDRIYSVEALVTYFNGDQFPKELLSASLKDALKENAPEMETVVRLTDCRYTFLFSDKELAMNGFFADSNFFDIFTLPAISGSTQLSNPGSIIISDEMAVRVFGNTGCIGKSLVTKDNRSYVIQGVFRDVPRQSTLQFDFILPYSEFIASNPGALDAGASSAYIWTLLEKNTDPAMAGAKIRNLISGREETLNQELFLFPLSEKVLYDYAGGRRVWREMQRLFIGGAIGLAILLIACFNFINIQVALNLKRYRETGIRKVYGSGKGSIILQFLFESALVTLISLVFAIILVNLLLTVFNAVTHFNIHLDLLDARVVISLVLIAMFTAIVAGLLPALYMSSINPADILRGKTSGRHSFSMFRRGLIVFQFIIPVTLIISMMIIKEQDRFMYNYDTGIDKNNVIVLRNPSGISNHAESFKSDIRSLKGVEAVSFSSCIPARGTRVSNDVSWQGMDVATKLHFWCVSSDFDYDKLVDISIKEGRYFDPAFSTDSAAYLLNDVAVKTMDLKNPVGSVITVDGKKGTVIGIVSGFHSLDLAGPLVPTIFRIGSAEEPNILVRYNTGDFAGVRDEIKKVYEQYEKDVPFNASLVRDLPSMSGLGMISGVAGGAFIIALLLACAGLSGLASYAAESRTKEIGIRKANGATTFSMMKMLLSGYARWLLIAYLISVPFAVIIGKFFLMKYNFHTVIPIAAFITGPLIVFLSAILTVSFQTWRVASQDPVKSLRYE